MGANPILRTASLKMSRLLNYAGESVTTEKLLRGAYMSLRALGTQVNIHLI